eukprot:PhF_6_TR7841/c1_g1_i4/m.11412
MGCAASTVTHTETLKPTVNNTQAIVPDGGGGGSRVASSVSSTDSSLFITHRPDPAREEPFISSLARGSILDDRLCGYVRPVPHSLPAALLFVDISGYSAMAAVLAPIGAHALADVVNAYYARMIEVVQDHRGDVVKFAGDAMLVVWWEGEQKVNCTNAAACAVDLQKRCGTHTVENLSKPLRIHCGITSGTLRSELLVPGPPGDPIFHFISGPPLKEIESVVDSAAAGETCVSEQCIKDCGPGVLTLDRSKAVAKLLDCTPTVIGEGEDNASAKVQLLSQSYINDNDVVFDSESADAMRKLLIPPAILTKLRAGIHTRNMAELRDL